MTPMRDPQSFVVVSAGVATGRCPRPDCDWTATGPDQGDVGHRVVVHFNTQHSEPPEESE